VTATAGEAADDIGDHDLVSGRDGAEPRGLDHGRTKDVAVLARRFARGDADADLHRIAAGAAPRSMGRLLHGDGAGDGARALSKRSIRPSPVVFTSLPLCFVTAPRSAVKCAWRSAS